MDWCGEFMPYRSTDEATALDFGAAFACRVIMYAPQTEDGR
jgi:hypothetical protein